MFNLEKPYKGWLMVATTFILLAICVSPFNQGVTAWFVALKRNFMWTQGQLSWSYALPRVAAGLFGPLNGTLVQRVGSRRVVLFGMFLLGAGFILFSRINELWQLYVVFVMIAVGGEMSSFLPMLTVVNNWFIRRRALAIAMSMEGFLIGAVFLVPLLAWAIDPDADRFGWRTTSGALGLFIIAIAFPITRLIQNRPRSLEFDESENLPDGQQGSMDTDCPDPASRTNGLTWQEAVRTSDFWIMMIGQAFANGVSVAIFVHIGLMLDDIGFSLQTIGWIVSTYTGTGAIFIIVGGYLGDKFPIRVLFSGFTVIQSIAILILLVSGDSHMVFVFALFMGIGFGGRIPLQTAIRAVYFGRNSFASIMGVSQIPINVASFLAPLLVGYARDITLSYNIPFLTIACVGFLGAGLVALLGPPKPYDSYRRV